MHIKVKREKKFRNMWHGRMRIDGEYVCDTLERDDSCLPPGKYEFTKSQLPFVASNGVFTLKPHKIAVGKWVYLGFIILSLQTLRVLKDRLRKSMQRHRWVELEVDDID